MINQDTKEWHRLRKNSLGASDAPAIMRVSPWKTPYQLWQEKLGLVDGNVDNEATRKGKLLEEPARRAYCEYTGIFVTPEVVFHKDKKFMHASLDGLSLNGDMAVEIKVPGHIDHEKAKNGEIPEKYIPQLQHQLACLDINFLHYFSFRNGEGVLVEVARDEDYIQKLYAEEQQFWDKVQSVTEPDLLEKDYGVFEDEILASKWRNVIQQINDLEKLEKEYRTALIAKADGRNAQGCGIRLTKVVRKGNVDYKAIPVLKGLNLDVYRKAPVQTWRITSCKE